MSDGNAYQLTEHAREEAKRRSIPLDVINDVMRNPEQIVPAHSERLAYQSKVMFNNKVYLVRVIVQNDDPLKVITVYRTSNINKYWRDSL